jgi:restriction endonuclease S subunit
MTVIRPFNIKDLRVDDEEIVYISKEDVATKNLKTYTNGDIVFSRVGDIRCGTIDNFDSEVTISPNIIAVKVNTKAMNPYYICTFMNTKYGYMQLERMLKIVAQPTIETETVAELLIPELDDSFQVDVERTVKLAFSKLTNSKSLCSQAENLLLEELGLEDFQPKYELSYTANLSKAFGAHRVDAEYFQPAYENLVRHLAKLVGVKPLRHFLLDIKKGIEVGGEQYQEEGKPFIRVSNLSVSGFFERDQKYVSEKLYRDLSKDFEPKVGELLLTKDATPGVAYVLKEPIEGIISSGILRLIIDETAIDKEYVALCINSVIGKLQVERDGGGSVITHWKPEQIKRLNIPALSGKAQKRIASLIHQSHEARRKARNLLEEAKRKVEEAIEGATTT